MRRPQTVAKRILSDKPKGEMIEDWGSAEAKDLEKILRANGFKGRKVYSYCTKASFESHLEKEGVKVEIIASNFMGKFVDVKVWR